MLTDTRHQRILDLLEANGDLRVPELTEYLGVSEATVRRDLVKLAQAGYVQRTYGGAALVKEAEPEPPIIIRTKENTAEKQRIAKAAAALVKDDESVFIGSGTTALEVARNLSGRKNLTVITNALTVVNLFAREEGISVIVAGGLLRNAELSFLGHITAETLRQLRPQKIFMGIRAISLEAGLTSDYLPEVTTDRAIIESSPEVILVADHTKFGRVSPAFVAPVTSVTRIVTDDQTPPGTVARLRELGIDVIVC